MAKPQPDPPAAGTSSNSEAQATACALIAVALWSTVATGFKLGLQTLSPLQLLFAGTLVSVIFFWSAALYCGRYRLRSRQLGFAFLLGLSNPFAYYIVLFSAYDRLPAQLAQPINYTWAIAVAVLAVPVLGQKLSRRALTGILISYAGVFILLTQGNVSSLPQVDMAGVALALISTLLWAGYWLMTTKARLEPIATMAWSFSFALPAIALACHLGPGLPAFDSNTLFYGAWVGLLEMGITFVLWQRALRLTHHAGRISQLIFLSPFVSLLLIASVLGEQIHFTSVAGLLVIIAGIILTRETAAPSQAHADEF